ncbi:MAG: tyrosine-type recombinase/integrase [Deltaproteobacteria bacterium]|nr:tyrosine-type recombinase/integrase [Deltaproteobacteria bacterium]
MKRTYESLGPGYRSKSAHCLRHTFATDLASRALGDTTLCKMVLGHKDEETTARYVHLFEQINQKSKMKIQRRNGLSLVR